MQKNKLARENIKTLCNNAAKKLVALGLVSAVGGANTLNANLSLTASAQVNEKTDKIEAVLEQAYEHDLALGLPEYIAQANRERDRQRLMSNPAEIDAFEAFINSEREIETRLKAEEKEREERDRERKEREREAMKQANARIRQKRKRARINHIEGRTGSHIHPISNDELTHDEVDNRVNVDRSDIAVSDFSNDITARDVKANAVDNVALTPNITVRIQNGAEFELGRTAQETLENLQHTTGLPVGRRSRAQQPQSSNGMVKFIISVLAMLWCFSFGSLLGISGGSK